MQSSLRWQSPPTLRSTKWRRRSSFYYNGPIPAENLWYRPPSPTLPALHSGVPCFLDRFNSLLRTSYTMNTPSLPFLLDDCITKEYDFGTAYGHLHAVWYTKDWNTVQDELRSCEAEDWEEWQKAVHGNGNVNAYTYPWHVWDLYGNRVVVYQCGLLANHIHMWYHMLGWTRMIVWRCGLPSMDMNGLCLFQRMPTSTWSTLRC